MIRCDLQLGNPCEHVNHITYIIIFIYDYKIHTHIQNFILKEKTDGYKTRQFTDYDLAVLTIHGERLLREKLITCADGLNNQLPTVNIDRLDLLGVNLI